MSPLRPCIERDPVTRKGCPRYALPGGSRCRECEAEHERNRGRSPSSRITWTAQWKRVRARVVDARRLREGTWTCEICGQRILSATDIDVDHIVPVSEGGAGYDEANLRLAHRRCNRRLGGLTAAEQRQRRTEQSRIGRDLAERRRAARRIPLLDDDLL